MSGTAFRIVRYRLRQNGLTVAAVEGPEDQAIRDIRHYAAVYGQDGPVEIQVRRHGGWEPMHQRKSEPER